MKSVLALALVGAVAAVPAWNDVDPAKSTTTTAASTSWADYTIASSTTKPVKSTSTSSASWADWSSTSSSTKPVKVTTTTTPAASTWADYATTTAKPTGKYTTSVVYTITTVVEKPTTFWDKTDAYTATGGQTLTLTKGPYTVTIPYYEETSTVCGDKPVSSTGAASWSDAAVPTSSKPAVPASVSSTWADVAVPTGTAAPVSPYKPSTPVVGTYTGSASKMAGAGLAGVAAIAALLL